MSQKSKTDHHRLSAGVGARHGIVLPPVVGPRRPADPAGVVHASVPAEGNDVFQSAGGGAATDRQSAESAAIAEALERYAAASAQLQVTERSQLSSVDHVVPLTDFTLHSEDQQSALGFPWVDAYKNDGLTMATDLASGERAWLPVGLVALREDYGGLATSSGLAADFSARRALLRATQEVVERDAFMAACIHDYAPARIEDAPVDGPTLPHRTVVEAFDITPAYSPHPVSVVTVTAHLLGRPRHGLGVACRQDQKHATAKATLEALQSVVFAGEFLARSPELWSMTPQQCQTFDHHAVFYTANPDHWERWPLRRNRHDDVETASEVIIDRSDGEQLADLVSALTANGIRLFGLDLTTADLWQIGLRVVRVLSPDLTPIHHNHLFPHLGGSTMDVGLRFPDHQARSSYPGPFPHGLG